MRTIIAALMFLSLVAGPAFAAGSDISSHEYVPQPGFLGVNPNSPGLTGGGSLGHNRLQQAF
jgi:hypothetical protein